MGYFTWCASPFFLEAAGSGHRPTKYSLSIACAVLIRKRLHFASMATQQGNLYESTLETNEDLKIILNQAEDFNLSLKSNPENSP